MKIVKIGAEHLRAVAELERLSFSEPWSEGALSLLLTDSAFGVVCIAEDRVVAYGGALRALDEAQITNIAVHPDKRRMGYGRAVLRGLLEEGKRQGCTQFSLEVRVSNLGAIALYEREGFFRAVLRKGFYRDPREDAAVMLLCLENKE